MFLVPENIIKRKCKVWFVEDFCKFWIAERFVFLSPITQSTLTEIRNATFYTSKDAIEMTLFFLDNPKIGGIFNAGTGVVRTWNDLAATVFKAMDRNIAICHLQYVTNFSIVPAQK